MLSAIGITQDTDLREVKKMFYAANVSHLSSQRHLNEMRAMNLDEHYLSLMFDREMKVNFPLIFQMLVKK